MVTREPWRERVGRGSVESQSWWERLARPLNWASVSSVIWNSSTVINNALCTLIYARESIQSWLGIKYCLKCNTTIHKQLVFRQPGFPTGWELKGLVSSPFLVWHPTPPPLPNQKNPVWNPDKHLLVTAEISSCLCTCRHEYSSWQDKFLTK